jgi:hypothetical protein
MSSVRSKLPKKILYSTYAPFWEHLGALFLFSQNLIEKKVIPVLGVSEFLNFKKGLLGLNL